MTRVIRIPRSAAVHLGIVRAIPRISACECEHDVWLKFETLTADEERRLRQIPGAEWFQLHGENELIPHGKRLPKGFLPNGVWQRLSEYVVPQLNFQTQPTAVQPRQNIRLVHDNHVRPAAALLTQLEMLADYVDRAPLIRLSQLRFAANQQGKVLVVGTPLPPLRGTMYWDAGGIFIPSGLTWTPPIEVELLRDVLARTESQWAFFHTDSTWESLDRNSFVAVKRSAVRSTWEKIRHASI